MNRDTAVKILEQVRPLLSHETNKALDVAIVDCKMANEYETRPTYWCDYKVNTTCKKGSCISNGGACRRTTNEEFAVWYEGKALRAPAVVEVEE